MGSFDESIVEFYVLSHKNIFVPSILNNQNIYNIYYIYIYISVLILAEFERRIVKK